MYSTLWPFQIFVVVYKYVVSVPFLEVIKCLAYLKPIFGRVGNPGPNFLACSSPKKKFRTLPPRRDSCSPRPFSPRSHAPAELVPTNFLGLLEIEKVRPPWPPFLGQFEAALLPCPFSPPPPACELVCACTDAASLFPPLLLLAGQGCQMLTSAWQIKYTYVISRKASQ